MKHIIATWFEIPVENMERAMKFYGKVFDCELERHQMGEFDMGWFPFDHEKGGAGGSLVKSENDYKPSKDGTLIYFATEDLSVELARVPDAGGKIIQEKTEISPEIGFMGLFTDTEGNRIALHSQH